MLTLAVDLSSSVGTLCLFRGKALLQEVQIENSQRHSELFLGALDTLLKNQKISLEDVDRFLTTSGPGSFTGLRIGWSSLKAFALASGKILAVVSGDEARARAWVREKESTGEVSFLTPMGKKSWVKSTFLLPKITLKETTITENGSTGELFPLRARYLIDCPDPIELKTAEEISSSAPDYLGSTRW